MGGREWVERGGGGGSSHQLHLFAGKETSMIYKKIGCEVVEIMISIQPGRNLSEAPTLEMLSVVQTPSNGLHKPLASTEPCRARAIEPMHARASGPVRGCCMDAVGLAQDVPLLCS